MEVLRNTWGVFSSNECPRSELAILVYTTDKPTYILVGFWSWIMAQILWKALLSENVRCSFMYKLFRGRLAAFSPTVFITFFLFSFFNNFYNNSFISCCKKKKWLFCDWNEFFNQRSNIGQIREYYEKLQKHRY